MRCFMGPDQPDFDFDHSLWRFLQEVSLSVSPFGLSSWEQLSSDEFWQVLTLNALHWGAWGVRARPGIQAGHRGWSFCNPHPFTGPIYIYYTVYTVYTICKVILRSTPTICPASGRVWRDHYHHHHHQQQHHLYDHRLFLTESFKIGSTCNAQFQLFWLH